MTSRLYFQTVVCKKRKSEKVFEMAIARFLYNTDDIKGSRSILKLEVLHLYFIFPSIRMIFITKKEIDFISLKINGIDANPSTIVN